MHHKFIACSSSLALYLLVLTILSDHLANGNGIVMEHADGILDHTQSHTSTHHMDQSTLVFFTPDDLKLGRVLPIYFRGTKPSSSPQFLPREEANLIPFSLSKLHFLVQYFGFSRGSSQAKAMENTLRECGVVKPIRGETKLCATSLESMLDFVHEMLGVTTVQVQVLSTQKLKTSATNVLRNYTIVDQPREVEAPKMVACHTMPYPYVIYYCHYQKSESKVFQVSLKRDSNKDDDDDGDNVVEAVAVCHMDTSQWSQNHVSFKVLGIKPGTSPVCHFFPEDNLVWVPSSKDDMSLRNHVSPI